MQSQGADVALIASERECPSQSRVSAAVAVVVTYPQAIQTTVHLRIRLNIVSCRRLVDVKGDGRVQMPAKHQLLSLRPKRKSQGGPHQQERLATPLRRPLILRADSCIGPPLTIAPSRTYSPSSPSAFIVCPSDSYLPHAGLARYPSSRTPPNLPPSPNRRLRPVFSLKNSAAVRCERHLQL